MKTIEIDIDVHKAIERERVDFSETENSILKRLLNVSKKSVDHMNTDQKPWTGKGVTIPHGSEAKMSYNGIEYYGKIENGNWNVEGQLFHSPSAAASNVAKTKYGGNTSLNGWHYWEIKFPNSSTYSPLWKMREESSPSSA